jgi:tetratricopeptide (TPR) repeat protein
VGHTAGEPLTPTISSPRPTPCGRSPINSRFRMDPWSSADVPPREASLATRLLQVAGEFEVTARRERAALEARLASARDANVGLERESRVLREDLSALNKQTKRLELELADAGASEARRARALEAALLRTRFELAERTASLSSLYGRIAGCIDLMRAPVGDDAAPPLELENAPPPGSLALAPARAAALIRKAGSALETLLPCARDVELMARAARETGSWSVERLVEAARLGDERGLDAILRLPDAEAASERVAEQAFDRALAKALRCACRQGHLKTMLRLIAAGARAHAADSAAAQDYEPLDADDERMRGLIHIAAENGHDDVLGFLLGRDSAAGATAATAVPLAPILSACGATIDDQDAYGRTPLHLAAAANHAGAIRLLLVSGADPLRRDAQNFSAARVAEGTLQVRGDLFLSGELAANAAAPAAAAMLQDKNVMFWNASLRAHRHYCEKRYAGAIEAYTAALELAPGCSTPSSPRDMATLHYNRARARYRLGSHLVAIEDCTAALLFDRSYRNALAQRAECHMSLFDFDRAQRDFQSLMDADPADRQWARRLVDARAVRDLSHYGVLGVAHDAEPAVIKRAYRALCLRWHPDKQEAAEANISSERAVRSNTAFRVRCFTRRRLSRCSRVPLVNHPHPPAHPRSAHHGRIRDTQRPL